MGVIWSKRRGAVVCTTLLALFAGAFIFQPKSSVPIGNSALIAKACGVDVDCLANALADIMEVDGIDDGLAQMSIFSDISDLQCHTVSHATGKEMYQRVGNELLMVYENLCDGGFTHGWMSDLQTDSKIENLVDSLRLYCEGSPSTTICTHGIGHSLGENNVSVAKMTDICEQTSDNAISAHPVKSITGICVEGWIMGKIDDTTMEIDKGIEDALLLCKPLRGNLYIYCAGQAYLIWINKGNTLNFQRIPMLSQYCDTLKDIEYKLCTDFLGQAIGSLSISSGDIETTVTSTNNYCSLDNKNSRCLNGVLYTFSAGGNKFDAKFYKLCRALKTEFFERCSKYSKK